MKRTVEQIAQMSGAKWIQGDRDLTICGVSTDSRSIDSNSLFVPLVGDNFDGHDYVEAAVAKGAAAILWQKDHPLPSVPCPILAVEDTLQALQQLAHNYRRQLSIRIVAITGSNGKTSTKDMIASVLQESFSVQKTAGNLNNHIGVPLTLLSLHEETDVAVVEMGMNHAGEIRLLAQLAEPDIGVITNIGESHIEFFGSRSGIADAKWELVDGLAPSSTAVLLGDEPLLKERQARFAGKIVWFGVNNDTNDMYPVHLKRNGLQGYSFQIPQSDQTFHLPVLGEHQVTNALAAIAVARCLGMDDAAIAEGLAKVELTKMRMQVVPTSYGWSVINDAYNASPTSMKAAFHLLAQINDRRKIAVLGDMLELGTQSAELHKETGCAAAQAGIDELLCVGAEARHIARGALQEGMQEQRVKWYTSVEEVIAYLLAEYSQRADLVILVKGSRGMKMERVVHALAN